MSRIEKDVREKGIELLVMSPIERVMNKLPLTLTDIAEFLGVTYVDVYRWNASIPHGKILNAPAAIRAVKVAQRRRIKEFQIELKEKRIHTPEETKPPPKPIYDSEAYLESRSNAADKALMTACEAGNANALRTFYQLTKRLVEKQEITHKVYDGSFYAKAVLQAERELREESGRISEVQEESTLLRPELRLLTGQDKTGDNTLGFLAPPVEGSQPVTDQEDGNNPQSQATGN